MNGPNRMDTLAQLVADTEALLEGWAEAPDSINALAELLQRREPILHHCADQGAPTPAERDLANRLCELDQQLLRHCRDSRGELARLLGRMHGRVPSPAAPSQILSDVA